MAELKTLGDFYDPTKAMAMGVNIAQNQQRMEMQQQQLSMQQQNAEITNLHTAFKTAPPMAGYPIYKRIMELNGQAPMDVDKYYASPEKVHKLSGLQPGTPEYFQTVQELAQANPDSLKTVSSLTNDSMARAGAATLLDQVGAPNDQNSSEFMRQSDALQRQAGAALFQSPKQKEEAQRIATMNREHEQRSAYINKQLGPLSAASVDLGLKQQRVMPHIEQLTAIEDQYKKDLDNYGSTAAVGKRLERMQANPELQQFEDRRKQSIPVMEKAIADMETQQAELEKKAHAIALGVGNPEEGQSIHTLAGDIDTSVLMLENARAQLKLTQQPTRENAAALSAMKDKLDERVKSLTEERLASQASLDVRRDAQQEIARKNEYGEKLQSVTNEGKRLFAALPKNQQDSQSAARISGDLKQQYKIDVGTDDIMSGVKDPNRPLTQVNLSEEKAEAKKVGEGFGEQYMRTQDASVAAAGMIAKLDRMDTLLAGVTTGKLTPKMTEIQSLGEAIGIKVDPKLGAKQAFTALASEMALQLRNPAGGAGMPGAMSDKDREFLQSMTPSLAQTNEGNKLIIETSRKVAQRDQQIAKMARTYRKKNGHLDEGFYDEVQAYGEKNPLFKGQSLPTSGAAPRTSVAPFNDTEKERRYQEWKKNHK